MAHKPSLLFYFLHLLGVGHVYRAKRLIEGFTNAGISVDVIYGGVPIPGINFDVNSINYLPPIRAGDNAYSFYLDDDGNKLDTTYQEHRRTELLNIFESLNPDLILTEAFPFGRRMVRKELLAFFNAAAARQRPPLIVSSVRDILQERKKSGRAEETRDLVHQYFDHVLVHSDPEIIRLNETFPLAFEVDDKLTYTGFVVPKPTTKKPDIKQFDIIVSAGGGAFGGGLMESAMKVAIDQSDYQWCLTTGPNLPTDISKKLHKSAPPYVSVVPRLENLAAHISKAKISISQCGYNTAMDVLSVHSESSTKQFGAVFVPYDTEGQSEQLRRAELLERAGYGISLPESKLSPASLLASMTEARKLPPVNRKINFDGVDNSAKFICQWIKDREQGPRVEKNS